MKSLVRGIVTAACAGALLSGTMGAAAASTSPAEGKQAVSSSADADSYSPKRYEDFYFLLSNCHNAGELGIYEGEWEDYICVPGQIAPSILVWELHVFG